MMQEKLRIILRIAISNRHTELCIGVFGVGYRFRNPAIQVAEMWYEILFIEEELKGCFSDIVFAIQDPKGAGDRAFLPSSRTSILSIQDTGAQGRFSRIQLEGWANSQEL